MVIQLKAMFPMQKIIGLLLAFSVPGRVGSAPVAQANSIGASTSTGYEPAWVAGPTKRGTLVILFSCILTLVLCVWTTLHSNIEPEAWQKGGDKGASRTKPLAKYLDKYKFIWSTIALLFPEIPLCIAAHERRTAGVLCKEMKAIKIDGEALYEHWDITLAYYAVMGGFVVERRANIISDSDTQSQSASVGSERLVTHEAGISSTENIQSVGSGAGGAAEIRQEHLPPRGYEEHRRTITPHGVLRLAKEGLFPAAYKSQTVKDKSKANALAKFLVCFQAIWMIIQVCGRYATRLPVTLLELYTVLHTICAVVMYVVWMDKPFSVGQPTFVSLDDSTLGLLLAKSDAKPAERDAERDAEPSEPKPKSDEEQSEQDMKPSEPEPESDGKQSGSDTKPSKSDVNAKQSEQGAGSSEQESDVKSLELDLEALKTKPVEELGFSHWGHTESHCSLDLFWNHEYTDGLTSRAGLGKLLFRQLWDWEQYKSAQSYTMIYIKLSMNSYVALWNGWSGFRIEALGLSCLGFAYGGLHLAAWGYKFPSDVERQLWKTASVLTATSVLVFFLAVWVGVLGRQGWNLMLQKQVEAVGKSERTRFERWLVKSESKLRDLKERFKKWVMFGLCLSFAIAAIPCIFGRLYLLVESFVAMRKLPLGSYDVVLWSNFLPHFG